MNDYIPDHADIYKRVEKVEIDVAVMDAKVNRLGTDLTEIKTDMKVNGILARELKTKVDTLPKIIVIMLSLGGVAMSVISYIGTKI